MGKTLSKTCSMHVRDQKSMQGLDQKTLRAKTSLKI